MDNQPILLGDLETQDRDPQNHNDFLKVGFPDVICEPPSVRSPQCTYQFTQSIYDNTTLATYSLLTLIFGGLLSFLYGLIYGMTSFMLIWIVTPFTRLWCIPLGLMAKIWFYIVKCFYDPLYVSCGRIFSNVNINFHSTTVQNV